MSYGKTVTLDIPFPEAVSRVREALQEQGFGVLNEIDVTATMQAKLGEQVEDYVILGACNPRLAFHALETDRRIGLLLPCNVVVRATEAGTVVDMLDPQIMIGVTKRSELKPVADEASRRLDTVLAALASDAKKGLKYCPLVESAPTEEASSARRVPERSGRAALATMIVSNCYYASRLIAGATSAAPAACRAN